MQRASSSFVLLTVLAGCKAATPTTSVPKGVASGELWPKTSLTVCFNDEGQPADFPKDEVIRFKKAVAAGVMREYTPERTIITFTGFTDCNGNTADIEVRLNERAGMGEGVATHIGAFPTWHFPEFVGSFMEVVKTLSRPSVVFFPNEMANAQATVGVSWEEHVGLVAMHEFGHIAGLFHEHGHTASTCNIGETAALGKATLGEYAVVAYQERGTAYDPRSIMSYCAMFKRLRVTPLVVKDPALETVNDLPAGLSFGDMDLLQKLYR